MIKLFMIYVIIGQLLIWGSSIGIVIRFAIKYGVDSINDINELLSGIDDKSIGTCIVSSLIWPVKIKRIIYLYNYLDSALAKRYL